jgi:manganese oxidase
MSKHFFSRVTRVLGALALAACSLPGLAAIPGISGTLQAGVREFRLVAADNYISTADGVTVYMWGFGDDSTSANATMQYPAPTLIVNQGERVRVLLRNTLPTPVSLMFPGHALEHSETAHQGFLSHEAARGGAVVSYEFTASQAGTFLYQSGTQPHLQLEMGLVGALIVRPTGSGSSPSWAYNHADTAFEREVLMLLSEIDPVIHQQVETLVKDFAAQNANSSVAMKVFAPDMSRRQPQYWFINGRTSPDSMAANNLRELPTQPYNSLPRMYPGERLLLRVIGAGADAHPLHHHGNNSWVVGRDGRMLGSIAGTGANLARSDYTIRVMPGQTYDAIWSWTGAGLGWDIYGIRCDSTAAPGAANACPHTPGQLHQLASDRGKPFPTRMPSQLELSYGEFYSGSPFLGGNGAKPVGAGQLNPTGAIFHMIHSHNEKELLNGGIFPGGMATMIVIEPRSVTIVE